MAQMHQIMMVTTRGKVTQLKTKRSLDLFLLASPHPTETQEEILIHTPSPYPMGTPPFLSCTVGYESHICTHAGSVAAWHPHRM